MAGRIAGITIEIGGDTTKLQNSLKGVDKSLKQTQNALKDVNKLLKLNPGNTELLTQKQRNLKKAINDTKDRLKELRKAAENTTPDEIGQEKYDALQREIIDTENKLKSLESEMRNFGSVSAQKIKVAGEKMQKLGQSIQAVGKGLTTYVTVPIMALGAASVAAYKEVDAALDIVAKKTGAAGEELDAMEESVKTLAETMPTSFEEAATAVGEVNTRFGVTGEELETLSAQFIKFAKINCTDVNSSIDSIQSAMAAFGLSAEDAEAVLDLFNAAGQQTGVSVDALAESLKKNAVALQEMGLSIEDSAMFLAQLDKAGVDSTTVLSGLKKALAKATKEGKPMDQALEEIQASMQGAASDTEAAQIATELFGSRAGTAIAQYVRNGQLDFETLSQSMDEYAGSVSDTYDQVVDPMDEMTMAMNTLKDVGYEIATAAMPMISKAMEVLRDIVTRLKAAWDGLTPQQQEMIVKFALLAAAIGPVLIVLGKIVSVVGTLMTIWPLLVGAIGAISAPVIAVVAVIAGLIAIGVLLYKNWDKIKAKAAELKEKISQEFDRIKQKITDTWNNVVNKFNEMKAKVTSIMTQVQSTISNKITAAKNKVSQMVASIKNLLSFSGLAAKVSSLFNDIKSKMTEPINKAKELVSSAVDKIKSIFPISLGKIFSGVQLPHFHISGGTPPWGIMGMGEKPTVSIEWYRKAMQRPYVLDGATIFGAMNGKLLGGGESGKEVILGYDAYKRMAGGVTVNMTVNAAPGMDEMTVANIVARKINRQVKELGAVW